MIIKGQPEDLQGKPLISGQDPHMGDAEIYLGRVIIEFWSEQELESQEPAFAWSVDEPEQPDEAWLKLFLNGLKGAIRHLEESYGARQPGAASSEA